MKFWVFYNTRNFFEENFPFWSLSQPKMVGKCWSKFAILVTLEPLIWHFEKKTPLIWHYLVQFQHQTQQYEQNLTNFNYVYGHAFTRKNALFGGLHVFTSIKRILFIKWLNKTTWWKGHVTLCVGTPHSRT